MSNQPTATAFVRGQESWSEHLLTKLYGQIEAVEAALTEAGVPVEEWDKDTELMQLEEDVIFYERYAEEMAVQREYIRTKYLGG